MAGDGKTDFYAEIGLKLNESQAKKEATKGAKITSDAMKKALEKSLEEMERKQAGAYFPSGKIKFSSAGFLKDQEIWKKIIAKNEAAMEKELKQAFMLEALKKKEKERAQKAEDKIEALKQKQIDRSLEKRLKEEETVRKAENKEKEKARKKWQKDEQNRIKREFREKKSFLKQEYDFRKNQEKETLRNLKSLGKWAFGVSAAGLATAGAGFALGKKIVGESTERAFNLRNLYDQGVNLSTLRKWQAASYVFGNIKEEESAQSLVNLRDYRARMARFGEGASLHANKLLGVDWSQKDEKRLINDIANAILQQSADIQGVLTEEVFGSKKYLSVFKRWKENPSSVWGVEKEVLRGTISGKDIRNIEVLGENFRRMELNAANLKDQLTAIISIPLNKYIDNVNVSIQDFSKELIKLKKNVKPDKKPSEGFFSSSSHKLNPMYWVGLLAAKADIARGFMPPYLQEDPEQRKRFLYAVKKQQNEKNALTFENLFLPKIRELATSLGEESQGTITSDNKKNITVNVGGITVNKDDDVKETVRQAVWGATSVFDSQTTNMFVELPTLGR